jgi:hypothetical protein
MTPLVDQARRLQQEECSEIRRQINLLGFSVHQQLQLNHRAVVGSLDLQRQILKFSKLVVSLDLFNLSRAVVCLDLRRQILKLSKLVVSLDLFNLSRVVACLDLRRQILNLNRAAGCFQLLERSQRKLKLGEVSLGRIILHNQRNRVDSSVG